MPDLKPGTRVEWLIFFFKGDFFFLRETSLITKRTESSLVTLSSASITILSGFEGPNLCELYKISKV